MTPKQIREFILAGNALFTLKSLKTGKHYTFKVKRAVRYDQKLGRDEPISPPTWRVAVLNGRDNSKDYRHIGNIRHERFWHPSWNQPTQPSVTVRAFGWFWRTINDARVTERFVEQCEFKHAGKCGRCGRPLTVPSSIDSGIGPECADKMAFEAMGGADGLLNQLFGG